MKPVKSRSRIRSIYDQAFDGVVIILVFGVILVTLYPIIYILSNSISTGDAVLRRQVWLWPIGFNLQNYERVFQHPYILLSYRNTLFYTVVGTLYSMVLTILGEIGRASCRERV
jgi:putative aldouronate transport system permease protein